MTYASILVHVDPREDAHAPLRLAAGLARRLGARLIGVGAEWFEPIVDPSGMAGEVLLEESTAVDADLQAARAVFQRTVAQYGIDGEWREAIDEPAQVLARESRSADLIVVGPQRAGGPGFHPSPSAGEVIMRAGRPVLVAAADQEDFDPLGVVIGWKDTPEARRAVADALPLLKRAPEVSVVEFCRTADRAAAQGRVRDVAQALGRHGVNAQAQAIAAERADVRDRLAEFCADREADLLVLGAYGHGRLREWLFGGVTRRFLAERPLPILFSR